MNYLPSKKVALFVVVLIVLTVGGLWYAGGRTREIISAEKNAVAEEATNNNLLTTKTEEEIERSIEPLVIPQIASGQAVPPFKITDHIKVYTEKNISLIADNSPDALRNYGLLVASALKPFSIGRENEVDTLLRAIDNKRVEDIASLANSREVKQVVLQSLLSIKTPSEARDIHLSLINSISTQIGILKNMEQAFTNPILALQSATFLPSEQNRFYRIALAVNEFFSLRKISFEEKDKTIIVSE